MQWLQRLEQLLALSTTRLLGQDHFCVFHTGRLIEKKASPSREKSSAPFSYEHLASISDTIVLPDGRRLGFARYGHRDGPQMFYLHGFPGSRVEGSIFFE